jgi:hypothetical protein
MEEGADTATSVDKEVTDGELDKEVMGASDNSKQGPESEIATETQNGKESEVTNGGDPSKNGPEDDTAGPEMVSPGEGGADDDCDPSPKSQNKETERQKKQKIHLFDDSSLSSSSLGSTDSSNITSDQVVIVPPQSKFRGKKLLFQALLIKKARPKKKSRKTSSYRKFTSRVTTLCLYNAVFAMFLHHDLPGDLDLLREIVKDTMTTISSMRMPTITPQSRLNAEVASWNTIYKATTQW